MSIYDNVATSNKSSSATCFVFFNLVLVAIIVIHDDYNLLPKTFLTDIGAIHLLQMLSAYNLPSFKFLNFYLYCCPFVCFSCSSSSRY